MSDRALADRVAPYLKNWGAVAGRHLLLPELRAFWPFSSTTGNADAVDISGQARTLTNTASTPRGVYNNLAAYYDFNGSTQYLARTDEVALSITGAHTYGGWFRGTAGGSGGLFTKLGAAGQRSYEIILNAGAPRALVSSDGTAITTVTHTTSPSTDVWFHAVARYIPSTSLSIFINGVEVQNTTSIPASVFDSSADLRIGARGDSTLFFDGQAALCFLCADDLPSQLIEELYLSAVPFFSQ